MLHLPPAPAALLRSLLCLCLCLCLPPAQARTDCSLFRPHPDSLPYVATAEELHAIVDIHHSVILLCFPGLDFISAHQNCRSDVQVHQLFDSIAQAHKLLQAGYAARFVLTNASQCLRDDAAAAELSFDQTSLTAQSVKLQEFYTSSASPASNSTQAAPQVHVIRHNSVESSYDGSVSVYIDTPRVGARALSTEVIILISPSISLYRNEGTFRADLIASQKNFSAVLFMSNAQLTTYLTSHNIDTTASTFPLFFFAVLATDAFSPPSQNNEKTLLRSFATLPQYVAQPFMGILNVATSAQYTCSQGVEIPSLYKCLTAAVLSWTSTSPVISSSIASVASISALAQKPRVEEPVVGFGGPARSLLVSASDNNFGAITPRDEHAYIELCDFTILLASTLTTAQFDKLCRAPGKPCLIAGAAKEWKASAWANSDISTIPEQEKVAAQWIQATLHAGEGRQPQRILKSLSDAEDNLRVSFMQGYKRPNVIPDNALKICAPFISTLPQAWVEVSQAMSGSVWNVNHLNTSSWSALVLGKKRWAVYDSSVHEPYGLDGLDSETSTVLHSETYESTEFTWGKTQPHMKDSVSPKTYFDNVHQFLSKDKKPMECIQNAGDVVYLPAGYWNTDQNLEDSFAITESFMDEFNANQVLGELAKRSEEKGLPAKCLSELRNSGY